MGKLRALPIVACLVLAACTFPPLATPSPTPSPSPTLTPTPSPTPTPSATPSPSPVPDIPSFQGRELVTTTIDGMRVRQRPATDSRVIANLLPLGATLEIVMGPIVNEDLGWYLVRAGNPSFGFEEGWIAAGTEADPFLVATGSEATDTLTVVGLAGIGEAEHGPVTIDDDAEYAIRWVAADPDRSRCTFALSLATGNEEPVPAIRATVGNELVPGTLQPNAFAAIGKSGLVFLSVTGDCAWTFAIVRVRDATPEPSPSG